MVPCQSLPFFLLRTFGLGGADWTLHVEGYGGTVHVPPDDHGGREDHGCGSDVGVAASRRAASSDGGEEPLNMLATTLP